MEGVQYTSPKEQPEVFKIISQTEKTFSNLKKDFGDIKHLDLTYTAANNLNSLAKKYQNVGKAGTAKTLAQISNEFSKIGRNTAYLLKGFKRIGGGMGKYSDNMRKFIDKIAMDPIKASGQFIDHLEKSSLAIAELSLRFLFDPNHFTDILKNGMDTFANKVEKMSKGELLQEGTYLFFNLITFCNLGTIAPVLAGASTSEAAMLFKVIKNFNLIFKKEAALAKQLLQKHKFLENYKKALTPITTTFVNGVEVLAISLGCGKESAKRVIEILKKNSKIIKKNGLVGTAKKVAERVGRGGNFASQTIPELLKSKVSFEKLIQKHKKKLFDYMKNPYKHDNKGLLRKVSEKIRQKRINGRIVQLKKQIKKQQGELNKINELLKRSKKL